MRSAGQATGGTGASSVSPTEAAVPTDARAAPESFQQQKDGKPTSLGTPLKKRLSFGREKKQQAPKQPAAAPVSPAFPSTAEKGKGGGAAAAPKAADGDMDDEELDQYLKDLELNHDRERTAFAADGSPG